jgi:hypothetical protein
LGKYQLSKGPAICRAFRVVNDISRSGGFGAPSRHRAES